MASNTDDVFSVDNYDKIFDIIESLAKTTCEKPALARLDEPVVSTVKQSSYRYFKFNLYQSETSFSVGLRRLTGQVDLFYSFEVENPKDEADYIADRQDQPSGGLVESARQYKRNTPSFDERFYQIDPQTASQKKVLYMSVKGSHPEQNDFVLRVYNRTLSNGQAAVNPPGLSFFLAFSILIALLNH